MATLRALSACLRADFERKRAEAILAICPVFAICFALLWVSHVSASAHVLDGWSRQL